MSARRPALVAIGMIAIGMIALLLAIITSGRSGDAPGEQAARSGVRVVALGPSVGIILKDLGLERLIVGRHGWDLALDPALPVCGDLNGIDYENLLAAAPTHVLLEWGAEPVPRRLEQIASERGWKLETFNLLTLQDIEDCVDRVGALLERELEAERLASLRASMARAWSERAGLFRGRVLLLAQTNPPSGVGPGSFHHQILERIGGRPAIVEGGRWVRFDTEDVVRLAPEGIVLIAPRGRDEPPASPEADPEDQLADLLDRLGPLNRDSIPAVRAGRIAMIDHPHAHTASTAMIHLADELAEVLAAWGEAKQQSSKTKSSR